jgi:hypothetical protein
MMVSAVLAIAIAVAATLWVAMAMYDDVWTSDAGTWPSSAAGGEAAHTSRCPSLASVV